ncbi:hypothetical protein [Flavobacterium sp.]|uniref:hypothetical protein n=1 Tax=Flavobacterium sp. TaxID=239 RepID=UPI00286D6C57|nr:hypothetical protein [Flavobacterium sp.]
MKTIIYIILITLFSGCNLFKTIGEIPNTVNKTENLIDDAIAEISNQSSSWQTTLQDLEGKLVGDAQSTVRTEIQNLASRTIAAAGAEFRCNSDFLGARVIQGLQRIKARLLNQPIPELRPVFCSVIPQEITMSLAPDRRNKINISGYDFDNQPNLKLFLHSNGRKTDLSQFINRITHYEIVLNLGNNGLVLNNASDKITLEYNNQELSSIPIIQPQIPTCIVEDYQIPTATYTLVPAHIQGDKDFFGHGPRVDCDVKATIEGNMIKVRVFMKAQETAFDNTKAEGTEVYTLYTAPSNRRILSIVSDDSSSQSYTDGNLEDDYFQQGSGEFVKRFVFTGDTAWGGESGTKTKVVVELNRLSIRLQEVGNCTN